jgi:two-component system cell cycle sensor histidine kinase/response regulator CckA
MKTPLRVLMVEDSEPDMKLTVRELERGGFDLTVERVADAAGFAAALERASWQAILSDCSMPGFSAQAALEICQARKLDAPFIIVSGSIGEEAAVALMKAGAHDYVMKDKMARLTPVLNRELRDARDRAARRRAEADQSRLATILEATIDFVATATLDWRPLFINQAGRRMIGLTLSEDRGIHHLNLMDFYPTWAADLIRDQAIPAVLRDGAWSGETALKGAGDTEIPVSQVILAHRSSEGVVEYLSTIARDLTAHKRLETQYRQAQKMEAVGRLAGGVAHDFNNLLTAILGYSELLMRGLAPQDPFHEGLSEIYKAGQRAAALTQQLLAFSRKLVLEPRVLDLNAVVADVDRMLRRLLGEDIEFSTVLAAGARPVKTDPGQMDQVILNLAINARDAMPKGGKLTIETANVDLDESYHDLKAGAYTLLAVSDTGCGMDDHVKSHLFEPFFTTKEPGKGTGLGLATVFGIVKQSGGHVAVYSEPGQGATFKVYLPSVTESADPVKREPATAPSGSGSETILIVEDEAPLRSLMRTVLQLHGYKVLEAHNGQEALGLIQMHHQPIHLIISDVIMPKMGGRELSDHLAESHPNIRVLAISGYTDDAIFRHGMLQPGAAFLQKPFTPSALLRKIREVLSP